MASVLVTLLEKIKADILAYSDVVACSTQPGLMARAMKLPIAELYPHAYPPKVDGNGVIDRKFDVIIRVKGGSLDQVQGVLEALDVLWLAQARRTELSTQCDVVLIRTLDHDPPLLYGGSNYKALGDKLMHFVCRGTYPT